MVLPIWIPTFAQSAVVPPRLMELRGLVGPGLDGGRVSVVFFSHADMTLPFAGTVSGAGGRPELLSAVLVEPLAHAGAGVEAW